MELPKRGTSMAPFVTKPDKDFFISKKVKYDSKLKQEGVIMEPKNFKAWASKLDKLKQVVRVANPSEMCVHQSRFTMTKRRAFTVEQRPSMTVI